MRLSSQQGSTTDGVPTDGKNSFLKPATIFNNLHVKGNQFQHGNLLSTGQHIQYDPKQNYRSSLAGT